MVAPKRSEERQRRNRPVVPTSKLDVSDIIRAEVVMPDPDENWHPIARRWYEALAESAQCVYYEPSDWAVAFTMAESLSRDLNPRFAGINEDTGKPMMVKQPLNGASINAYGKIFASLLLTEGDRRRLQIEITRSAQVEMPDIESGTSDIAAYRRAAISS